MMAKYTMHMYCNDYAHLLPEGASILVQISQEENGLHSSRGATYRQSFIEISNID